MAEEKPKENLELDAANKRMKGLFDVFFGEESDVEAKAVAGHQIIQECQFTWMPSLGLSLSEAWVERIEGLEQENEELAEEEEDDYLQALRTHVRKLAKVVAYFRGVLFANKKIIERAHKILWMEKGRVLFRVPPNLERKREK